MSKEELVAALQALEANPRVDAASRETASLIHDCEANQSDLEVQNRQLREAEAQLERAVRRYMDLYDFAPIVYLTLDDKGLIQEANLTAAAFLETERTHLIGMQLLSLVAARHRAQLRAHLQRCVSSDRPSAWSSSCRAPESSDGPSTPRVFRCSTTPDRSSAIERP